jgi:hypothetical protein
MFESYREEFAAGRTLESVDCTGSQSIALVEVDACGIIGEIISSAALPFSLLSTCNTP